MQEFQGNWQRQIKAFVMSNFSYLGVFLFVIADAPWKLQL